MKRVSEGGAFGRGSDAFPDDAIPFAAIGLLGGKSVRPAATAQAVKTRSRVLGFVLLRVR